MTDKINRPDIEDIKDKLDNHQPELDTIARLASIQWLKEKCFELIAFIKYLEKLLQIEKYLPEHYDLGDDCTMEFALKLTEKDKQIDQLKKVIATGKLMVESGFYYQNCDDFEKELKELEI